jgi:lipopolysaccharide/colanic/teichoic acid biosynthesis glycosyltransferase
MYSKFVKRSIDLLLISLSLVLISPLIIPIAILVKLKLGSPILFTQDRPGYQGKIFKMYKFRTMTDDRDSEGNLLPDSDRAVISAEEFTQARLVTETQL